MVSLRKGDVVCGAPGSSFLFYSSRSPGLSQLHDPTNSIYFHKAFHIAKSPNMRWWVLVATSGVLRPVLSAMSFTNQNSHSAGQAAFSKNDVHAEDSVVTIGWTGVTDGEFSTVFLWQINVTKAATDTDTNDAVMGGGEYVTSKPLTP